MIWKTTNGLGQEVTWYTIEEFKKIKNIANKTLNMVDYRTYFKRDNKSLKQEGFKTLYEILKIIEGLENG